MKTLLASVVAVVLVGCGTGASDLRNCVALTQPEGGVRAELPSKVSLTFAAESCDGTPITTLTLDRLELEEDGKKLSPYESRRALVPMTQGSQVDSLVLLDLSGSVLRSGAFDELASAAARYVDAVTALPNQQVAIATFDGRRVPQPLVGFTNDRIALQSALASLRTPQCKVDADCAMAEAKTCAAWRCVDDSTDLNGAVLSGLAEVEAQSAKTTAPYKASALVVFTDGSDQAGRVAEADVLERVKRSSAQVFTVGLGPESELRTLSALGKSGQFEAREAAELQRAFEAVAERVRGLAGRFYRLEYCSPKRDGVHALTVRALIDGPSGVREGKLETSFDATGFASGCAL